jgi:hypothetical protein
MVELSYGLAKSAAEDLLRYSTQRPTEAILKDHIKFTYRKSHPNLKDDQLYALIDEMKKRGDIFSKENGGGIPVVDSEKIPVTDNYVSDNEFNIYLATDGIINEGGSDIITSAQITDFLIYGHIRGKEIKGDYRLNKLKGKHWNAVQEKVETRIREKNYDILCTSSLELLADIEKRDKANKVVSDMENFDKEVEIEENGHKIPEKHLKKLADFMDFD